MSKLTEEQKRAYLAYPYHCPFCEGNNLDSSCVDWDAGYATQDSRCEDCGKRWRDTLTVTDVTEINR